MYKIGCFQISANNLTPLCYSKNNRYSAIIPGQIVGQEVVRYSTRPHVEYLYFRRIWQILVESTMTQKYKLLLPDSSKNSTFILKKSANIWYSTRCSTPYLTGPRSFKFTIRLWLDLGHGHLVFASMTNLESVLRFAEIWLLLISSYTSFFIQIRE